MVSIESVKTDLSKEIEGVWVEYEGGISLKIARLNNPVHKEVVEKLSAPHMKGFRAHTIPQETRDKISKKAVAETILLDWKNIDDADGNPIPYSREKALEFFENPELADFYDYVVIVSNQKENYRKQVLVDSEKN